MYICSTKTEKKNKMADLKYKIQIGRGDAKAIETDEAIDGLLIGLVSSHNTVASGCTSRQINPWLINVQILEDGEERFNDSLALLLIATKFGEESLNNSLVGTGGKQISPNVFLSTFTIDLPSMHAADLVEVTITVKQDAMAANYTTNSYVTCMLNKSTESNKWLHTIRTLSVDQLKKPFKANGATSIIAVDMSQEGAAEFHSQFDNFVFSSAQQTKTIDLIDAHVETAALEENPNTTACKMPVLVLHSGFVATNVNATLNSSATGGRIIIREIQRNPKYKRSAVALDNMNAATSAAIQ